MIQSWHGRLITTWLLAGGVGCGGILPALAEPMQIAQAQSLDSISAQRLIDEGTKLFRQGSKESLQQALVKFAEAIRVSQSANDKARMALAFLASGRASDDLGNQQQALAFYERSLSLYKALGDRSNEATTLGNIGAVYSALGEKQKALEYYNQALLLSRSVGNLSGEATTLNNIGLLYSSLGEKQKALNYYNQSLPVCRRVRNRSLEATTLSNIGAVYDALGEKQKALEYYNQALSLSRAVGDRSGDAATLHNIGAVYHALGEMQKALAFYNQSLLLSHAAGNRFREARTLDNIGGVYNQLGEKQKALKYYNQALPLSRAVGDRSGEASTLTGIATVYSTLGEKTKALAYYNQALPLVRVVGDRDGEATALNNIGLVYFNLGENKTALEFYNHAVPLTRAVGNRTSESTTFNNIGSVYSALGEKQKSLEFYNQALSLARTVGDRSGEATTLNNIARVYDELGEKQKALAFYNRALPISRAVGNRSGEATVLNNIGLVYSDLGEKQKALEFFNQSLLIKRSVGNRSGEANSFSNIGVVYFALGEKQKALENYNQALPLSRAVGDRAIEASVLNNIGLLHAALGENQKALEFYNQALPLRRAVNDRSGEANTLNNIGGVYHETREQQKALEFYNQALPLQRAVSDRSGEATTLNNIGGVYNALGENQRALEFYNQSLPLRRAVGDRSGEAITLWSVAYAYRTQNRLPEALTQINASIALIEQLRSNLKDDRLKTSYFATVQSYYQFKIDLLMQLHQQDPTKGYDAQALETSDQSRARVLRDLLTESRANITKDISPALKQRENDLIQTLNAREKQLVELAAKPNSDSAIDQLKTEIQQLLQQQQTLKTEIRQANPAYAQLQYPKPITLTEIQQQLTPDTLLLQYQLGKDNSYLWVIGKTSFTSHQLPKSSDIEKTVQAFRSSLLDVNDPDLGIPAQALSQQILGPAASQLGQKRLLIIPDGSLHKIPFAALAQPGVKDYKPLLETHEISYLPAASLIAPQYPNRAPAPKTIALLADPIFNLKDDRLTQKSSPTKKLEITETIARDRAARSLNLSRIPGTAVEANDIRKFISPTESTIVTGFDSTYNWVTTAPLNQYRYLHLATHGIFDEERPELSSLIFSLYNAKGEPQRAFLRLPDLFNLNLPTEMVTLSACQTGLGNSVPGEGLVGMTRGLMYAGAKRVTVSLWSVADQETAQLMQQFYRNLLDKNAPKMTHSAALRSAQLQMWQQGIHPYYWSAFVMQGEWRN
jgi:tetratricopeptide (TPR) repeat protein/CHAT domain-containing protein